MSRVPLSKESRLIRGQLAQASRGGNDPQTLRRDFQVSKLADHIKYVVDQAPPLTKQQKSHLATLIRGA